ncbi:MAG: DUF6531 domain-containing protein, partial [Armatimonadota bacterium]
MRYKRFLTLTFIFCAVILIALFFSAMHGKSNLFAAQGTYIIGVNGVNNITLLDSDFPDTSADLSFVKPDSSNTYSVNISGKEQTFVINGYYGPNPCSPVSEGGNAYYAISICNEGSIYDTFLYVPQNIEYKIEFYGLSNNVLETVEGTSIAEYKIITTGSTKKIVGWIYGFLKPEGIKSKIGMQPIGMSYSIKFAKNDPAQIIKNESPGNMTSGKFSSSTQIQPIGLSPIGGGLSILRYPVDIVSGSLIEYSVDMALPGDLAVTRYYNSGMAYQPGKASGWMFNFEEFLRFDPDGSVFYRDNTFREYRFVLDPNNPGRYLPSKSGNFLQLTKYRNGNHVVRFKDQSSKVFNSLGLLIESIDPQGNRTSYEWELPVSQIRANYDMPAKLMAVMGLPDSFRANQTLTIKNPYGRTVYVDFNRFGRVAKVTDWSGRTVEYTWDDEQGICLLKYRDTAGNYTTFSYRRNILSSINYPNGTPVKNNYYAKPFQTLGERKFATGDYISYRYGWMRSAGYRYTEVKINGKYRTYYYDENGTITKIDYYGPSNMMATYKFSSDQEKNLVTSITDPKYGVSTYSYDDRGNITEIKLPNGRSAKYKYNDNNMLTDYWDTAGKHTAYGYDVKNNVISIKRPDDTKVFFEYDSRGKLIKSIDAKGYSTIYAYGAYGDLASITDAEGRLARFYRDTLGRVVQMDVNGIKRYIQYDNLGNITQFTDALKNTAKFYYDGNGNLTSAVNAKNETITFEYDVLDQLIRKTDPQNNAVAYRYDVSGNMVNIIDPMGGNIGFEYNNANYLSGIRDQKYDKTYYSYDSNSNLISISNPAASKSTEFKFDNLNRVIQKKGTYTYNYEYDNAGNLKEIRSDSGKTLYEYDSMNRLTQKKYPSGKEFSRRFDANGNVIYEKHINGDEFDYQYDKSGNLVSARKSGRDAFTCKYNQNRQLTFIEYPNKVAQYISYNGNGDIAHMKYISAAGEILYTVEYAYNELGQVVNKHYSGVGRPEKDISYHYDKSGRLIQTKSGDR